MTEHESGKIKVRRVPDPVPAAGTERRTFHVQDQREVLSGYVRREILRNALGETYVYDLVPLAIKDGGGYQVAYMLSVSTRSPLVGHGWVNITSKPFEYVMPEEGVQEIVRACMAELRAVVSRILSER